MARDLGCRVRNCPNPVANFKWQLCTGCCSFMYRHTTALLHNPGHLNALRERNATQGRRITSLGGTCRRRANER